jgi:hypothetical protein
MGFSHRKTAFQWGLIDQMMEKSETGSSPLNFLIDNKKVSLLADDEAGATSVAIEPYGSF